MWWALDFHMPLSLLFFFKSGHIQMKTNFILMLSSREVFFVVVVVVVWFRWIPSMNKYEIFFCCFFVGWKIGFILLLLFCLNVKWIKHLMSHAVNGDEKARNFLKLRENPSSPNSIQILLLLLRHGTNKSSDLLWICEWWSLVFLLMDWLLFAIFI